MLYTLICYDAFGWYTHSLLKVLFKALFFEILQNVTDQLFSTEPLNDFFLKIFHPLWLFSLNRIPAKINLLKVNKTNSRKRCEICLKLTIKTPERRHWRRIGVFIVTSNIFHTFFCFHSWLWTSKCRLPLRFFKQFLKLEVGAEFWFKSLEGPSLFVNIYFSGWLFYNPFPSCQNVFFSFLVFLIVR